MCAYSESFLPQHFDAGGCEHLWREIVDNILKVGVIVKKILSPFIYMTSRRALGQELSFAHIKVQVAVQLENRLAYNCKFQSL